MTSKLKEILLRICIFGRKNMYNMVVPFFVGALYGAGVVATLLGTVGAVMSLMALLYVLVNKYG